MASLVVDRIEDGIAVIELAVGQTFNVPLCMLPEGTHEGDVLAFCADGYSRKLDATALRAAEMRRRTERLFGCNGKGETTGR
ncbi:MAG: DUF3006 domain-containing protein [Tractidigestivibacter sp.]|jgi:hypothetical protein|uniref:DUF3006 domain-containing protein n=1 Tax=Tractidigestivibacter sp. TaxID=2847320 RepID=UPI003D90C780